MGKRIGVRYCGGCNPRYDRKAAVSRLQEKFPQHQWEHIHEGEQYDLYLMVCGCMAACVTTKKLDSAPICWLRCEEDLIRAEKEIQCL